MLVPPSHQPIFAPAAVHEPATSLGTDSCLCTFIFQFSGPVQMVSGITSVITEPESAIIHFKNTLKSGFACITLLYHDVCINGNVSPVKIGIQHRLSLPAKVIQQDKQDIRAIRSRTKTWEPRQQQKGCRQTQTRQDSVWHRNSGLLRDRVVKQIHSLSTHINQSLVIT